MKIAVLTVTQRKQDLLALLNVVVNWNIILFKTRALPPLYESGIRYCRETDPSCDPHPEYPRVERWQMADVLASTKRGDCEDLCLYRVGWLRAKGERARFRLTRRGRIWHVTLFRANGQIEDPSARLGMT